jgi:wobble nucleotide-excising tRNase
MINKIESIKDFGCFQDFTWDDTKTPLFQKVNIFYGYNGSGKTTLSNLFYLLSRNCFNKPELSSEYILDTTAFRIIADTEINERNYSSLDNNLYVFNTKFISDHIYDGSKSNMDSFGIGAKITNEVIDSIDDRISVVLLRNNKLLSWDKKLDDTLKEIWDAKKIEFNSKIQGKRLTNSPQKTDNLHVISNINKRLGDLYLDYYKAENAENLKETIELVKNKLQEIKNEGLNLAYLKEMLFVKINLVASDKLKSHVNQIKNGLTGDNITLDLNTWLFQGNELLKIAKGNDKNCPLCMSDVASFIDDLTLGYDQYFSEGFKKLIDDLNAFEHQIISVVEKINDNEKKFNEISTYLGQFKFDSKVKFKFSKSKLKKLQMHLLNLLSIKRNSPNSIVEFNLEANKYFEDLEVLTQKKIEEVVNFIEIQAREINTLQQRDIVSEIKEHIKNIAIADYNNKTNCIYKKSKKSNSQIATKIQSILEANNKLISELNLLREREIIQLDAETKFVNIYLEYLGISKFIIKKQKGKTNDNISIIYSTNGIKKNSLKFSLSEGEKTALAFAFFLSKIRAEQIEGGAETFDDCTIVIDDPISSLDENRLYHTANLIDTFFHYNELANNKIPKQTFILSHNINFLKYMSNIFYSNENIQDHINEYFIEPFTHTITKVPNGLKNFTTTYLEKIDEILKFNEGGFGIKYHDAKRYIPNYIRIVLESFFSFKLATVKEGSRERLPGLKFLIGKAIVELNNFDEQIEIGGLKRKGVIERLNNLKKIADNESHGSISKIESLNYISEKELKDYCKHTLQIIKYFDEIHFVRAKQLMSRK